MSDSSIHQPVSHNGSEASQVIWQWADSHQSPPPSHRKAGLLWGAGALAASLFYLFGRPQMAGVVISLSTLIFLLATLSPNHLFPKLESLFQKLGRLLATGVTWMTLLPLFFLFFVPFRFLFRRNARDSMKRFYEPNATTYWKVLPLKDSTTKTSEHEFLDAINENPGN